MASPETYAIPEPNQNHGVANKRQVEGYKLYQGDTRGFVDKAIEQWIALKDIFEQHADVIVLPAVENCADEVFTADASLSLIVNGTATTVISKFSNIERTPELEIHKQFFKDYDPTRIIHESPYNIEGTGDNVYDKYRDIFWSGYTENSGRANAASGRSDIRSHPILSKITNTAVYSHHTFKPYFHIDTSMGVLPRGEVLLYSKGIKNFDAKAFNERAFAQFGLSAKTHLIEVSAADAWAYACNLRVLGNTVVMPNCSEQLQDQIKRSGYNVITTDLTQFIYSGGGPHCLSNDIQEKKLEGGYANESNRHLMPQPYK